MASRRKDILDVREIVRRLALGRGVREIARDLDIHRKTVREYKKIAKEEGWLDGAAVPSLAEIHKALQARSPKPQPGPASTVEQHKEKVLRLRGDGVEVKALWQILRDEDGFTGSYASVLRFVRRLEPVTPKTFVRVEVPPGQEAQVDFGYGGKVLDPATGQVRRTWVFVMTLSFSRHQYAELVFDQKVDTWIACHVHAFEFFGGVARRMVIDNLKAAVVKACFHDPEVQRSYRELAEHYRFTIAPCRVRTPEHKGKVEQGGVHYVKRNALAGRQFRDIHEANEYLRHWCLNVAGTRDHGTLHQKPLVRFEQSEKEALIELPHARYEVAVFRQVKLHPDCHVVFEKSYYSAPHRLSGKKLWLRATAKRVELYYEHERVATHERAKQPGQRVSSCQHYPPDKVAGLLVTPMRIKQEAASIGEATAQLIGEMLADEPVDRLRGAQGILRLVKRYGNKRLEAACRRALVFGNPRYRAVESILRKGLDSNPLPPDVNETGPVPKRAAFARPVNQIAAHLKRRS